MEIKKSHTLVEEWRSNHTTTNNRPSHNWIKKFFDDNDKEWLAEKDLGRVAEDYFKKLFSTEDVGITLREDDVRSAEYPSVSQQQNEELLSPVFKEEVYSAVMDINPHKCPGPDGMNGFFNQQFWELVGDDLWGMVDTFFRTGQLDDEINKTNICLIPKMLGANRMQDFRPISLSNVAYKILAKIIAKRLKKVFPQLISESQAAFVHDKIIHDNILIAH